MTFDELASASFDRPLTPEERTELNRRILEELSRSPASHLPVSA